VIKNDLAISSGPYTGSPDNSFPYSFDMVSGYRGHSQLVKTGAETKRVSKGTGRSKQFRPIKRYIVSDHTLKIMVFSF
jgi:hypothetical protein